MSCLPKISCILYVTAKLLFIHYFMPTWCHHTVCRTFYLTWAAARKSTPPTTVLVLSSLNVSTTKTASSFSWFNWLLRKNIRQTSDIFYRMHWDIYRCNSTILLLKRHQSSHWYTRRNSYPSKYFSVSLTRSAAPSTLVINSLSSLSIWILARQLLLDIGMFPFLSSARALVRNLLSDPFMAFSRSFLTMIRCEKG